MEVYNEVENGASAGTAQGQKLGEPHHNLQMIRHVEIEEEADRNQLIKRGFFKPTSGNATTRLRMRQETCEATGTAKPRRPPSNR